MNKVELTSGVGAMRSMMEEMGATLSAMSDSIDDMPDEEATPVAHGNPTLVAKLRQMADEMEFSDDVPMDVDESFDEGDLMEPAFPIEEESGDYVFAEDLDTAVEIRQQVQAEELDRGDEANYARLQGYTEHVRQLRHVVSLQPSVAQPAQGVVGGESLGS